MWFLYRCVAGGQIRGREDKVALATGELIEYVAEINHDLGWRFRRRKQIAKSDAKDFGKLKRRVEQNLLFPAFDVGDRGSDQPH